MSRPFHVSSFPCLVLSMSRPFHVSCFPCLVLSMSRPFHVSSFPCLILSMSRPFHVSSFPCLVLSMSRPFHVSSFPCLVLSMSHPFHVSSFPCLVLSMSRPFHVSSFPCLILSTSRPFHVSSVPCLVLSMSHPFHVSSFPCLVLSMPRPSHAPSFPCPVLPMPRPSLLFSSPRPPSLPPSCSSKWGDAAIQVISFDEGGQEEPVEPGGIRFRSEFVHTMSLMHALALQRLRGDSHLTNLTYGRFMDIPPEPPVDAEQVEEWKRVRGNKSSIFLRAHRPHLEKYWRALPLAVLGGVNPTECSILEPSRDRVYLVMCWLHRALVARRMAGGISQDAPIVSRIYQVLSDGMLGYENALKIVNTPFPFPFAQCVALLLHINALVILLLMADWLADPYLASAITLLSVFSFYLLNEVAREIEEPFQFDPNDLPMVYLHHKFNERLVTAFTRSAFPADGLFTQIDDKEMEWLLAKHRPLMVTEGVEREEGVTATACVVDVLCADEPRDKVRAEAGSGGG
ncbi:unnamed protein product [Closterium sp. Naga37s-1]|nr:unnamed protein product [Closterium sp. Naga37s-1]